MACHQFGARPFHAGWGSIQFKFQKLKLELELELVELKNGITIIGIKIENCVNMVNGIKILQLLLQHLLDLEPTTSFATKVLGTCT